MKIDGYKAQNKVMELLLHGKNMEMKGIMSPWANTKKVVQDESFINNMEKVTTAIIPKMRGGWRSQERGSEQCKKTEKFSPYRRVKEGEEEENRIGIVE